MSEDAPRRSLLRYHGTLYDRLFGDWPHLERAALADGARPRTEVLWFNPQAWDRLDDAPLLRGSQREFEVQDGERVVAEP